MNQNSQANLICLLLPDQDKQSNFKLFFIRPAWYSIIWVQFHELYVDDGNHDTSKSLSQAHT